MGASAPRSLKECQKKKKEKERKGKEKKRGKKEGKKGKKREKIHSITNRAPFKYKQGRPRALQGRKLWRRQIERRGWG